METPFPGSDVLFAGRRFRFAVDGPNPDVLIVQVYDETGTAFQGQPIRFKDADGRVAADFPTVNDADFITNGEHGGPGSITNG